MSESTSAAGPAPIPIFISVIFVILSSWRETREPPRDKAGSLFEFLWRTFYRPKDTIDLVIRALLPGLDFSFVLFLLDSELFLTVLELLNIIGVLPNCDGESCERLLDGNAGSVGNEGSAGRDGSD